MSEEDQQQRDMDIITRLWGNDYQAYIGILNQGAQAIHDLSIWLKIIYTDWLNEGMAFGL